VAWPRSESLGGQTPATPRQLEGIDKTYTTTQEPLQDHKVGNGNFYRKPQTRQVFDEMTEVFLNLENSQKFTKAWFRYIYGFCPV
jgi:hypothetical protein